MNIYSLHDNVQSFPTRRSRNNAVFHPARDVVVQLGAVLRGQERAIAPSLPSKNHCPSMTHRQSFWWALEFLTITALYKSIYLLTECNRTSGVKIYWLYVSLMSKTAYLNITGKMFSMTEDGRVRPPLSPGRAISQVYIYLCHPDNNFSTEFFFTHIHCVSKNDTDVAHYNAEMLLSEHAIKWWFVIPPPLASVSALPGETWTPEICFFFSHAVYRK